MTNKSLKEQIENIKSRIVEPHEVAGKVYETVNYNRLVEYLAEIVGRIEKLEKWRETFRGKTIVIAD